MRKTIGLLLLTVFCFSCIVQLRNSRRANREIEKTESLQYANNDHGIVKKILSRHSKNHDEYEQIKFKDSNELRLLETRNLKDQPEVRRIAFNDHNSEIRKFAISNLRDQSDFRRIAFNDKDPGVRILAVKKLAHQNDLQTVLNKDKDENIRKLAMKLLD